MSDQARSMRSKRSRGFTGKSKRRQNLAGGLMLTSMLDILCTVLFYLLKNYSTAMADFNIGKDLSLPYSSASLAPSPALNLVVSRTNISLDGQPVTELLNGDVARKDLWNDGVTITKLAQMLKQQKERSLYLAKRNDDHTFTGTIVMQADKDLKFNLVKKVIYTAGISDFVMFKLAVMKKPE